MISDEHKALQVLVHDDGEPWAATGHRNFGYMFANYLKRAKQVRTILDFGAGNGTLKKYCDENVEHELTWTEYDPGIEGIDKIPKGQWDLIVSSDVLEHVEPTDLDETLKWMRDHSKNQYHYISGNTSSRLMADGRSVHLIVEPYEWWLEKFTRPDWEIQFSSYHQGRKRAHKHIAYGIMTQKL